MAGVEGGEALGSQRLIRGVAGVEGGEALGSQRLIRGVADVARGSLLWLADGFCPCAQAAHGCTAP